MDGNNKREVKSVSYDKRRAAELESLEKQKIILLLAGPERRGRTVTDGAK